MKFLVIDLFAGAGGATAGIVQAQVEGSDVAKVIAAVNHSEVAIASHSANHTDTVHFTEDIRTLKMVKLKRVIAQAREQYPDAMLCIWASVECTNYSKAKGGQARDADSRTLPEALYRYVNQLRPDYLFVENVVEFMAWGDMCDNGRPISMRNGRLWLRWKENIEGFGYRYDHRILNAADFGAHTKRSRYFACFAHNGHPIVWPDPTHAKEPRSHGMFGTLKPWRPVKEVLDFTDEGRSIFGRKKELSPKTLERIYAGLIKYVAGGKKEFLQKHFSGKPKGKVYDTDQPGHTITTSGNQSLVRVHFIQKTYGVGSNDAGNYPVEKTARCITTKDGNHLVAIHFIQKSNGGPHNSKMQGVDEASCVITTHPNQQLVAVHFLDKYYGTGVAQSIERPADALTTKDRFALASVHFIKRDFTTGGQHNDVNEPAGSVTAINPKMDLVKVCFLDKTYGGSANHQSIDQPAGTVLTNDKHYLVSTETGHPVAIAIYEDDCPEMVQIKEFMALYGIIDIKMRMLRVDELLRIQGFPASYDLAGNKTQQKWQIGNAVVPAVPKAWMEALAIKLDELKAKEVAA